MSIENNYLKKKKYKKRIWKKKISQYVRRRKTKTERISKELPCDQEINFTV